MSVIKERNNRALLLLTLMLLLLAHPAQAQDIEAWHELEQAMARGAAHDRLWSQAWLGIYGTSAAIGVVLASTSGSRTERYDARVRTATSTLAVANILMTPLPHRPAYRQLQALAEHDPTQALPLKGARQLAREVAQTEQYRQAWSQRLGSLAVNTAAGLVIGVGDNRPGDGLSTAVLGMVTTEVNIRTQPRTLSQARGTRIPIGKTSVRVYPQLIAAPGMFAVSVRF